MGHNKYWHLGSMNDAVFIIDTPPRPSTDDVWHDRPDGPEVVIGPIDVSIGRRIVRAHNTSLKDELVEATAELIYLRQYGKDGALWSANESKEVWRQKARAYLTAQPAPGAPESRSCNSTGSAIAKERSE
jgi:hypothetical protein